MTKGEALQAMADGKAITHTSFTSDEYMKKGSVRDIEFEDGCQCSQVDFWRYRNDECWSVGWSIYELD